jgi:hypothetical protein
VRYLTLAEALTIAEVVTGISAETLARASRLELRQDCDPAQATQVIVRLRAVAADHPFSAGVVARTDGQESPNLLADADGALHVAKRSSPSQLISVPNAVDLRDPAGACGRVMGNDNASAGQER